MTATIICDRCGKKQRPHYDSGWGEVKVHTLSQFDAERRYNVCAECFAMVMATLGKPKRTQRRVAAAPSNIVAFRP
jgi:hypothetical protein